MIIFTYIPYSFLPKTAVLSLTVTQFGKAGKSFLLAHWLVLKIILCSKFVFKKVTVSDCFKTLE